MAGRLDWIAERAENMPPNKAMRSMVVAGFEHEGGKKDQ
jgi:hypothetical protein